MESITEIKVKLKNKLEESTLVCHENDYDKDEWLRLLYSSYLKRMLSDNERIWKTGAIFIPLSLSAFAALVAIENIVWWNILILGIVSSLIIRISNIIVDDHRVLQHKSEAWLLAIQEDMGIFDDTGNKALGD